MEFELQPDLQNELIKLTPICENDFEVLYKVASDPLIWEQHPNKERYKREVFETFFKGAIESKNAFLILDSKTNEAIGSSRFYDFNRETRSVFIGYTFIARKYWGQGYNPAAKKLMMEHAFKYFDSVFFHIGSTNIRSQKAITKLNAEKTDEIEMEYYGEAKKLNFVYRITKENYFKKKEL